MPGSPKLSLSHAELRITDVPDQLLAGLGRVMFINTLGFDLDEDSRTYVQRAEANLASLLQEVVKYLAAQGIAYSLDASATRVLRSISDEEALFIESQRLGVAIKNKPPKSLQVPGFVRRLKPYQVPAVAHLVNVRHAADFSVPGSGKTTIVLAAFAILQASNKVEGIVVVGPRASFLPWENEFLACFGRAPHLVRVTGSPRERKRRFKQAIDAEVILLGYQIASNDSASLIELLQRRSLMLVIDESHNIKRFAGGEWSEALLGVAPYASKRVILTGTPVPNTIVDLWSQTAFLWPSRPILGPKERFRSTVQASPQEALESARSALSPFYWRIRKSELKLPPPRFRRVPIPMSRYQRAIYDGLSAKVLADVARAPEERDELRLWRRARLVRLLQAASNPALLTEFSTEFRIPPVDASGLPISKLIASYPEFEQPNKIRVCCDLVRRLVGRKQKVLVWTAFVHNIRTLRSHLQDLEPLMIFGEIPRDASEDEEFNRERMIQEFLTDERRRVLLANPSACAESISLHNACKHAIYLDRTFNAAHYMQSLDRIHRVGLLSTTKVTYYLLQSEASIDEVIDARINEKMARMYRVLEDDFAILDLESPQEAFSEGEEEARDFAALMESLRRARSV